ncbi:MAG: DUF5683 domain-containing protein [Dysgonamonadaceae bacterium]|jgi:hypothetical protein|nr:DUF5683 domain-containing protein [Dysgonamonadaceae bacterium]
MILTVCLFFTGTTGVLHAQDTIPETTSAFFPNDSIVDITSNDSTIFFHDDSIAVILPDIAVKDATTFKPNPKTAYLVAAVFPGFGQAYNRQYWKLPIVYGGLVGFIYAITWNNKNLQDYSRAYFDIKSDYANYVRDPGSADPGSWSQNWIDFTSPNRDPSSYLTDTNFHNQLKSGKDFYRRYRDLSIILSVAFYLICIADSYVDAQMFDFDISPDLSFRVAPEIHPTTVCSTRGFGLNVCMTF